MITLTETFGKKLNALRKNRNLTVQQLADKARVPATLISGLQNHNRQVGENNATRIGAALGLESDELQEFVYMAINNSGEKVLEDFKHYPAEVLNLVAGELMASGISSEDVNRCVIRPRLNDATPNAAVFLKDGQRALIEIKVTRT